jgi:hypothetical protein
MAYRWQAEAERLELVEEESKDSNVLAAGGDGGRLEAGVARCCSSLISVTRPAAGPAVDTDGGVMEDNVRGVIVINAQVRPDLLRQPLSVAVSETCMLPLQGVIQIANKAAHTIFGYVVRAIRMRCRLLN